MLNHTEGSRILAVNHWFSSESFLERVIRFYDSPVGDFRFDIKPFAINLSAYRCGERFVDLYLKEVVGSVLATFFNSVGGDHVLTDGEMTSRRSAETLSS